MSYLKYLTIILVLAATLSPAKSFAGYSGDEAFVQYFYDQEKRLEWLIHADPDTGFFLTGYRYIYRADGKVREIEEVVFKTDEFLPEFPHLPYIVTGRSIAKN